MRKILLATTALLALTGVAQAAESPISVTVGGYVDFRAAMFHESQASANDAGKGTRRDGDFETEYRLNLAAEGKATNGITYGAMVSLWNGRDSLYDFTNSSNRVHADQAYVWMSGAWGKFLAGDEHGATDLFVMAPTVGEGQIEGSYIDFVDSSTLARFQPAFLDPADNSTKVTYYTPKVGNANHKVQLGVSYVPDYMDQGDSVALYRSDINNYKNVIKSAARYTGSFGSVGVVVAPMMVIGSKDVQSGMNLRDFTAYGLGSQVTYAGFTLGGSYVDAGHYLTYTAANQTKDQSSWSAGLKYEFDKVAVAVNGMKGEGYFNAQFANNAYVDDFSAVGVGATYTWFPGLTTAADAVMFDQSRQNIQKDNYGNVLMLSQKMTF